MKHFESMGIAHPAGLRHALRKELPPHAFDPQPWRGVAALAQVPLMIAIGWLVHSVPMPWMFKLLCALVLGQLVTSVALAAGHEGLHHSIFRSHFWETVAGAIGVSFFFVTPGTWRAWHVKAHHQHTNAPGRDPECLRTVDEHDQSRLARFIHAASSGSGHWLSFVSFFFLLTMQGQIFLWHYSSQPEYAGLQMKVARERTLTVLLIAGWVSLGAWLGFATSLYVLIIPLLTANFTLLCYIATNHWLSPATPEVNHPALNTISTTTHPLLDWLHFNFSYHQEHHIFPRLSGRYLPLVRIAMQKVSPAQSAVYPQWRAVLALFRKPALYADTKTLISADGLHRRSVASIPEELLN